MSFSLTTPQVLARRKDVTRRVGWWFLKPGDIVCAIEKGQGLKKGEKVNRLAVIKIVSTREEQLRYITDADVAREGFPQWRAKDFIKMFCEANGCERDRIVNRIEFEYVDGPVSGARA